MVPVTIALELAVQDTAGVRIAREIGAARVELTQALALGGLTPSPATLDRAVEAAGGEVEVHVLVRPRAGGFRYDMDEVALMAHDVRHAVAAGAAGVVIGCQAADGALDRDAIARLVDAAGAASVTLHRVIDVTPDPLASLRLARELGLRRVLTSGGRSAAVDGVDLLGDLVSEAAGGIQIMAGGGIDASNVAEVARTGVDAVHFSAKKTVFANDDVKLGSSDDGGHEVTDPQAALAIVRALGL
ncbi:copper homeostasis protein CutC [Microbacterium sp. NPDC057650]|uniref:copper homeostasis protein CutC n=1 Tax=unclassified Microbacterium TaxID=2609290 RepID=UPI0036727D5A